MTIKPRGDADAQRRKDMIKSRCLVLEERRLEKGEKEGVKGELYIFIGSVLGAIVFD